MESGQTREEQKLMPSSRFGRLIFALRVATLYHLAKDAHKEASWQVYMGAGCLSFLSVNEGIPL